MGSNKTEEGDKINKIKEDDKIILQGRIYPAIKACVENRYKIILGIFVYYGFILNVKEVFERFKGQGTNLLVSFIFTAFIVHNFLNYWSNNKGEIKHEHDTRCAWPWIEFTFDMIALGLIWGAYFYFHCQFKL